jgi:hypothetical protein
MDKRIQWNSDAQPYDFTLDRVLYDIRRSDADEGLLMDAVTMREIIEDSEGVLAFDALVSPYAKLERKMELLRGVMERAGDKVKPVAMQITNPFKQRGVAQVAVIFELSDGQTVSIFFHNPDVTPGKMAPTDEVISWKWLLNKKDITIVVAPERGADLNIREVARRILRLAEKNSAAFQRVNAKRTERMQNIQNLKDEITGLEAELSAAQHELEVAKVDAEDAQNKKNRDYADAMQQISASQDAYLRATENGGTDPKTGQTKEALAAHIDRQSAEVQRLRDIANGVKPVEAGGNAGQLSELPFAGAGVGLAAPTDAPETIPGAEPEPQEFEHAGHRIYPFHRRWGVETKENKALRESGQESRGVGDAIADDVEAAKNIAESMNREDQREAQRAADLAAEGEAVAKAEGDRDAARREGLGGFIDGMSPMQTARVLDILNRPVRDDGVATILKDMIRDHVNKGWVIKNHDIHGRILAEPTSLPSSPYFTQKSITKIGMDFAAYLIAKRGAPPVRAWQSDKESEPAGGADTQKTADRALFQSVIDGTIKTADGEGILSPELVEPLEAAYLRHQDDPEMMALFEQAVNAYQDAMMKVTEYLG